MSFWWGVLAGAPVWLMAGAWAAMHLLAPRKAVTVQAPGRGRMPRRWWR